ncbi:hypothetical protein PUN28_010202 [Cardiocondyla obscurior]|uniref:Peptidase S1 domain-containing protein n=1 Tax=Cardiocondyla obscurior TaxID=286306 RepID=A0AAW2FTH6_9HYME
MQAVKVILFGLLLLLSMPNGTKSACDYYQNLVPGETYYVHNIEYPYIYKGENHCIYKMTSPYNVYINCTLEMGNNCYKERLSIGFGNGPFISYCGNYSFRVNGINPTILFDSEYNSRGGTYLCEIKTPNNNNCNCGWKKVTRIVGGQETGVNEFPMMSGMVDIKDQTIYCGATIISNQYVLTAAHCVYGKNSNTIGVIVGEHDTTTGRDTNATRLFPVIKIDIHPYYNNELYGYNDVAICKIYGLINYSAEVGPVCLPFQHQQDLFYNQVVIALGWGATEFGGARSFTLQKVNLNVQNTKTCQQYYEDANYENLCTYTPRKDTCQMDSGGPLLWQNPTTQRLVLVGIVSAGIGCASTEPSIAMRVGAYIDWIKYVTPGVQYCQIE